VVAVGTLFLDDGVSVLSAPQLEKSLPKVAVATSSGDVGIEYVHDQVTNKKTESLDVKVTSKKKIDRDIKAYTADGQYEIALINPDEDFTMNVAEKFVAIKGRIDGKVFNLRVPKTLIDMRANMQLRVINKKTGSVKTSSAAFLEDIIDLNARHFIDIDANDIDNVSYKEKKSILPLPGVAQDDD
jgi:hypothetical protein